MAHQIGLLFFDCAGSVLWGEKFLKVFRVEGAGRGARELDFTISRFLNAIENV
jgi:hypothetical protein